jgi:hypothetical protein
VRRDLAAAALKRIIVLGAAGFFGGLAVERLRAEGLSPMRASRRRGMDLQLDAEVLASLRSVLQKGDLVLDAAGPFQQRSTALVEVAVEVGVDVIDISDSLAYATRVRDLRDRIDRAGIRVLNGCSAVSAVSAALVSLSGMTNPVRASVFLAPAARRTANPATTSSVMESFGRPIRMHRDGRLVRARGWGASRTFSWGRGQRAQRGYLTESADAVLLPEAYPTLRDVDFWVDTQVPAVNHLLSTSLGVPGAVRLARRLAPVGSMVAKWFGSTGGGFGVEVEGGDRMTASCLLWSARDSYQVAIAPATLAARAIVDGSFDPRGLVRADRQVDPNTLVAYLAGLRVDFVRTLV